MLLNTGALPNGFRLVGEIENLGFGGERLFFVVSDVLLFLIGKSPVLSFQSEDEPGLSVSQSEFPLQSVPYFIDAVENKIWKSSGEGGLAAGIYHVESMISGEIIKISRDMNCGARYQKGISWKNFSRKPHGIDFGYQEKQITDLTLIEGGGLDVLKTIQGNKG